MIRKICRIAVSVILTLSMAVPVFAESPSELEPTEQYTITEAYEYPFVPGTPEWIALDNRKDACQIPEDVLSQMTTDALIETCLNYPFASDIYVFNSVSQGITVLSSCFNGLQELSNRPDGAERLLARYQKTPVVNSKSREPSEEKFDSAMKLTFLEGILSDDSFFHQLSEEETVQFEEDVAQKYEERQENASLYFNPSPYYEKAAIEQGIKPYDTTVSIKTPKGTSVTVYVRNEMDSGSIEYYNNLNDKKYPTAIRYDSASNKYNCHNYAWNNKSRAYWMDNPYYYMHDGSYQQKGNAAINGCIVYWVFVDDDHNEHIDTATQHGVTHSGIVQNRKMLSKWGPAGLYLSDIAGNDSSPYNSYEIIKYYTKQS